jgi:uncharacterized protein YqgV (UPF0045/DUF77 family)
MGRDIMTAFRRNKDAGGAGRLRGLDTVRPLEPDVGYPTVGKRGPDLYGASNCGSAFSLTFLRRNSAMEASVAIQSLPAVADDEELCRIVDEVIAYIASTGYNYFVGPFETTIEGPYDELMDIVKECQHIAIKAGAPAVAAYVKISYKPEGEVLSIEKKIGKYQG